MQSPDWAPTVAEGNANTFDQKEPPTTTTTHSSRHHDDVDQNDINVDATDNQFQAQHEQDPEQEQEQEQEATKNKIPQRKGNYHVVASNSLAATNAERLFDAAVDVIAIENPALASKFATSIVFGNSFHKTSVLAGLGAMLSAGVFSKQSPVQMSIPLTVTSVACCGFYNMFIATDPISQYQIDKTGDSIALLPSDALESGTSYSFLIRKSNTARIILHSSISSFAAYICYRQSAPLWHATMTSTINSVTNIVSTLRS